MGDFGEEEKIKKLENELQTKNMRIRRLEYDLEGIK